MLFYRQFSRRSIITNPEVTRPGASENPSDSPIVANYAGNQPWIVAENLDGVRFQSSHRSALFER